MACKLWPNMICFKWLSNLTLSNIHHIFLIQWFIEVDLVDYVFLPTHDIRVQIPFYLKVVVITQHCKRMSCCTYNTNHVRYIHQYFYILSSISNIWHNKKEEFVKSNLPDKVFFTSLPFIISSPAKIIGSLFAGTKDSAVIDLSKYNTDLCIKCWFQNQTTLEMKEIMKIVLHVLFMKSIFKKPKILILSANMWYVYICNFETLKKRKRSKESKILTCKIKTAGIICLFI